MKKVRIISGQIDLTKPTRLQISLFNNFCTEENLHAIVIWLNKLGVQNIEFQISDTLQKYNYMWRKKISKQKATKIAKEKGNKWITENQETIRWCIKNFNKVSITKWDMFTKHPEFPKIKSQLQQLITNDINFHNSLEEEIKLYFNKIQRTLTERRNELSKQFFIEEIAVSDISTKYFPANEIYPGKRIKAEQYIADNESLRNIFSLNQMRFIHLSVD